MCIKTLYVEKEFVLRGVVSNRLQKIGFSVDTVGNDKPDFLNYDMERYDLLIFSQGLATTSTADMLREVKRVNSSLGIIIVLDKATNEEQIDIYEAGADIVITRPIDIDLFIARINSIKRRLEVSNYKRTIGDVSFNIAQQYLECNDSVARLNPTESKLLLRLADGLGKGIVTNDEITRLLYQTDGFDSTKGTKVYIYRIRNKLKRIKSEKIAIKNHYGEGYYLVVNE